jgi:hypothetical protein
MSAEEKILEHLAGIKPELEQKKKTVYSEALLKVDRTIHKFRDDQLDFLETIKALTQFMSPPQGSELELILNESKQNAHKGEALNLEIKRIGEKIQKKISSSHSKLSLNEQTDFNQQHQAFKTLQISPKAFALFLKEFIVHHKLPAPDVFTGNLEGMIHNQKRLRNIQGTRVFDELESYIGAIEQSLLKTEQERELHERSHVLYLLEKFAKLELTREEWKEVKPHVILSLANKLAGGEAKDLENSRSFDLLGLLSQDDMIHHTNFYKIVEARDQAMLQNLKRFVGKESAILVVGGFHQQGLAHQFEKKDNSYITVNPTMTTVPAETNYRALMQGEVSWSPYFEVKDGKVSLREAFLKATRDKLLRHGESLYKDKRILKQWRDQIIRDLAEQERISEVSERTHLIDELVSRKLSSKPVETQFLHEWKSNIDHFLNSLKSSEKVIN